MTVAFPGYLHLYFTCTQARLFFVVNSASNEYRAKSERNRVQLNTTRMLVACSNHMSIEVNMLSKRRKSSFITSSSETLFHIEGDGI